ncbi:MAG: helix-turn-helix domain-containing protein [Silvanigrellaceae bacterium]|nr:helix-turn-helix domain-containing protein [Silvanigrellaceae bacterium]
MSNAKKINDKSFDLIEHKTEKKYDDKWRMIKDLFTKNKLEIIKDITTFRNKNKVGVNQFCREIDISSRQYYRLMDDTENISLMTMAQIAEFMNCDLEIKFKKRK